MAHSITPVIADDERPTEVGGALGATKRVLRDRPGPALQRVGPGQAECGGSGLGKVLRLVEAPLAAPRAMDRHGHQDLATSSCASPALREGLAEHRCQPPLTPVLEGVERLADRAPVGRAPFELQDAVGERHDQAHGQSWGLLETAHQWQGASLAQRRAFAMATRTGGRQQEIEHATHGAQSDRRLVSRRYHRGR